MCLSTSRACNKLKKLCQEEGLHVCGPQGPVTHNIVRSKRRAYMSVDLKGLGTNHVTWCWGTEEDLEEKNHSISQHVMDIST